MKKQTLAFWALGLFGLFGIHASCDSGSSTAASCTDGIKNGTEGDVDCGMSCGVLCAVSKGCGVAADCTSGVCTAGSCVAPSCTDEVKNGDEAGVDCGGSCPTKCANSGCASGSECQSGVCTSGVCQAATCTDKVKNGTETDIDCGGPDCPNKCAPRASCDGATDCSSAVCLGGFCAFPTCTDTVINGKESDTDCGGGMCNGCADGKKCTMAGDCLSNVCAVTCQPSQCNDGAKNGTETDVDCGGAACLKCADTKVCNQAADCMSGVCTTKQCAVPTCMDTVKNGMESDVDCGGMTCTACIDNKVCNFASDCMSGVCTGNKCIAATCSDTVKNGTETDVDCGGSCTTKCAVNKACAIDSDCASNTCNNKVCLNTPTFTSVTPNMGRTTATTAVTLNGTNLFPVGMAATGVTFGGTAGTAPNVTAATTATTTAPMRANMPGLVPVVLTLPGNHVLTLNNGFRYYYGTLAINAPSTAGALAYDGLAVADVDNDTDMDIFAAHPGSNTVDILRNGGVGNGTFTTTAVNVGNGPTRLAAADFDGNGTMDVAVSHTSGVVWVLYGNGAGAFPTNRQFPIAGTLAGIVAVDVDGVNKKDILVANTTGNAVAYLKNDGTGNFAVTPTFITVGAGGALQMATADFNKDGRPDIVFTSNSGINAQSCINNMGTGYTCSASVSPAASGDVAVGDINSDGNPDFVLASGGSTSVFSYLGKGDGTFTQVQSTNIATNAWINIQITDIDKDTYADVIFSNAANTIGVCRGDNTGKFTAAAVTRALPTTPKYVAVGQFNTATDQKDDFATGTANGVQVTLSAVQ